jgi:polysaccharide export outer membrane protein
MIAVLHTALAPLCRITRVFMFATALFCMATTVHSQCADPSAPDCVSPPNPGIVKQSPASVDMPATPHADSPDPDDLTGAPTLPQDTFHSRQDTLQSRRNTFQTRSVQQKRSLPTESEPPTEFQRFVAESTGVLVPVYGADLFTRGEASFGPVEGPAPPETIVGPDDEIRLRVWGQVNLSANLRVSQEGEIYIAKVGSLRVAGLPFSQVSDHIRSAMERVYRNFDLSVDLGQIHSIQVYVTGFARKPGEHTVSAISTLVDAIFMAGGPAAGGSMRHVIVRRKGTVVADFDLYALLIRGDKTGDIQLQPGDVLYIPSTGAQVALMGSVRQPAIYEIRGTEVIAQLLEAGGGTTSVAAESRISIERTEDHAKRRADDMPWNTALTTELKDGDILRIYPIVSTFTQTVTLRGAVVNPGHFAWHEGMRLSELMPDRESLTKRDYWWRQTQLGISGPEFKSAEPDPNQPGNPSVPSGYSSSSGDQRVLLPERSPTLESPAFQTNWNYAVIERLDPANMKTHLIPFNVGKLVLDHDLSFDMNLMPGDVVTIFTESDIHVPLREQTKYITLEGEFVHPGVYSVSPGENLQSLVERAGGLTQDAYLYASVFTRKSVQQTEAQHLNEAADRLEHQLLRKTISSVSSESTPQVLAANRELVARLRSVRPSGRIVLDIRMETPNAPQFPDIHLEDGDRLAVPPTPETVQVQGEVFNPHAFIFRRGGTAKEYLNLAGGPTRDADRRQIFVLRADGTVARQVSSSMFAKKTGEMVLHPGDSVVVPEKFLQMSKIAEVLAWTGALSQASTPALTAAVLAK